MKAWGGQAAEGEVLAAASEALEAEPGEGAEAGQGDGEEKPAAASAQIQYLGDVAAAAGLASAAGVKAAERYAGWAAAAGHVHGGACPAAGCCVIAAAACCAWDLYAGAPCLPAEALLGLGGVQERLQGVW